MKTCRRCKQSKAISEFRPDPRYRDGLGSWCYACHKERGSAWSKENRERLNKKAAERRAENPFPSMVADRKWKRANKEKLSAQYRKWRRANLAYDCARAAKRKATKLMATPKWADMGRIAEFYRRKPAGYDVDHIVPLTSQIVCGLHWECNLQYLPSRENQSKHNRHWPNMPDIDQAQRQQRMFE